MITVTDHQVLEGSQPVDLSKHPSGIVPTLHLSCRSAAPCACAPPPESTLAASLLYSLCFPAVCYRNSC